MKAHRTDLLSLAFGLLFLASATWWLLAQVVGLAFPPIGWFLAGALVVLGVLGVLGAVRSVRSAGAATDQPTGAVSEPPAAVTDPAAAAVEDWSATGTTPEPPPSPAPDDRRA